jgi:outer membrane protein OmpA-like peptidoglycan-associated protein
LLPATLQAAPASFGSNLDYTAVNCGGGGSFDPTQDANAAKDERDIVGSTSVPALYVRDDGTHAFFRLRLDANPIATGGAAPLSQFGWGIGLDSDGNLTTAEYTIVINGITESVSLVRTSDGKALKTWTPTLSGSGPVFTPGFVQVLPAGSALFGEPDFFLTVAVPMKEAADATLADPNPLVWGKNTMWAGTSTNGTSIDKDFTCWDDATPIDWAKAAADPVVIGTFVTISAPASQTTVDTVTPILSGTSEPNVEVTVTIGGQSLKVVADPTGKWSALVPASFGLETLKSYTAKVDVVDAQGNKASASVTFSIKTPTCTDGILNGLETDKDCGGLCATKCEVNQGCLSGNDCDSGLCSGLTLTCLAGCINEFDCDDDGLGDFTEDANENGKVDSGETDPYNPDSDGDGLLDGLEDANQNGMLDGGETNPLVKDSDSDGLADGVEDFNKNGQVDAGETNPRVADTDGDGIADGVEDGNKDGKVSAGETDPTKKDSDGDGLGDGIEDANKNGKLDPGETNALDADSDADGIKDGVEDKNGNGKVDAGETDPLKADTDGDGIADGTEDANQNGKVDAGESDPLKKDTDGDGLDDAVEDTNKNGKLDLGETDATKADTDGDGLGDGIEDANKNGAVDLGETNPLKPDTDGDGLGDGLEDANKNGKVDAGETDPLKADTDGDTIKDGVEDANQNGKLDSGETDPTKADTDGDGLADFVEDLNGNGKFDPGETNGANKDTDGDGLEDGKEDANKNGQVDAGETNPRKADSDDDGIDDAKDNCAQGANKDQLDTDKDGQGDVCDDDDDGDDFVDSKDVCPLAADPSQTDTDKDGIGDVCHDDDDNDGVKDGDDLCPLAADPSQVDSDGDKQGDVCDSDDDGDGVADTGDVCPLAVDPSQVDSEKDGIGDVCDDDDDNDGVKDGEDLCPLAADPSQVDSDGDKAGDACDSDDDGDGIDDGVDTCPLLANKDQVDTDADKLGDACDGDDDGDGVDDKQDTCPLLKGVAQLDTDSDGQGDACDDDDDGDGKLDGDDNCPLAANASQTDTDGDKTGDSCDDDDDGDGLKDAVEDKNGNGKLDSGETDPLIKDTDADGLTDGQEDFNSNGVREAGETDPTLPDTDGDGLKDGVEDADKDGEVDATETDPLKTDTDGDGLADGTEDKNGNGKVDEGETDPLLPDTDGDGLMDGQETATDPTKKDTDGDGLTDAVEDKNGNGKVDTGETDPLKVGVGEIQLVGGGCTAGPNGNGSGLLAVLAALGLLVAVRLRRREGRAARSALVLSATALLLVPQAQAAEGGYSVQRFRAATNANGLLHSDGGKLLGDFTPAVGLWLHYDHQPLTVTDAATGKRLYDEVGRQIAAQLVASFGLFGWAELGLAIPVVLNQAGDSRPLGLGSAPELAAGTGDIRVIPKVKLIGGKLFNLALSAAIDLPTASAAYSGDDGLGFEPRLTASLDDKAYGAVLSLGSRVRPEFKPTLTGSKQSIQVGSEAQVTVGGFYSVVPDLVDVLIDSRWSVNLQEQDVEERSGEVLGGVRVKLPAELVGTLAAGPGIGQGLGTPAFRAVLGLMWAPDPGRDTDGDGIVDKRDACPKIPEDKDDFEDRDGCVDPDNDKDGILDNADKCRDEPEDMDKFEDEDGCPELDNDKDGLADKDDKCPLQPEDKDGFEDKDGCIDPDNDKDGILDTEDKCPDEYGVKEEQGCPVRDKDKDGIPDKTDKCPDKAETYNGIEDEDGCPDKANKVEVTEKEIKILDKVFFETAKADIKPVSFAILDAVAAVLKSVPRVGKVRVEGHTDDVGADDANLSLSQARAESVVKYLVGKGVAAERLVGQGYGETKPLCKDAADLASKGKKFKKQLDACREQNRRVQFKLLEMNGKAVPESEDPQQIDTTKPAPAPAPAAAPAAGPAPAAKPAEVKPSK